METKKKVSTTIFSIAENIIQNVEKRLEFNVLENELLKYFSVNFISEEMDDIAVFLWNAAVRLRLQDDGNKGICECKKCLLN
jgi:hypothetical protein